MSDETVRVAQDAVDALSRANDRIRELEHEVTTLKNALAGERDEVKRLNAKYAPLVTRRPIPSDEWD